MVSDGGLVWIDSKPYQLARPVSEKGQGVDVGAPAFERIFLPVQEGDASQERQLVIDDWSRGIGDGIGAVRGAVEEARGVWLPPGRILTGPKHHARDFTTLLGGATIEAIAEDETNLYVAAGQKVMELALGTDFATQTPVVSADLGADVKSLLPWRGTVLAAMGSGRAYKVRTGSGAWKDTATGRAADTFGLSRTAGGGYGPVMGIGAAWARMVPYDEYRQPVGVGKKARDLITIGTNDRVLGLFWTAPEDTVGLTAYKVRYRRVDTDPVGAWTEKSLAQRSTRTELTAADGIVGGGAYQLNVRAVYGSTDHEWSNTDRQTAPASDPGRTRPQPPIVNGSGSSYTIEVFWNTLGIPSSGLGELWGVSLSNPFNTEAEAEAATSSSDLNREEWVSLSARSHRFRLSAAPGKWYKVWVRGLNQWAGSRGEAIVRTWEIYEGDWGVEHPVGESRFGVTAVLSHGLSDYALKEEGLYSFTADDSEDINVLEDLFHFPSKETRWLTPWHDQLLVCTAVGLYRVVEGTAVRTVGGEEIKTARKRVWMASKAVLGYGQTLYEARRYEEDGTEKESIIQYRLREEGDVGDSPLTPANEPIELTGACRAMTILSRPNFVTDATWLVLGDGSTLRWMRLLSTGEPAETDDTSTADNPILGETWLIGAARPIGSRDLRVRVDPPWGTRADPVWILPNHGSTITFDGTTYRPFVTNNIRTYKIGSNLWLLINVDPPFVTPTTFSPVTFSIPRANERYVQMGDLLGINPEVPKHVRKAEITVRGEGRVTLSPNPLVESQEASFSAADGTVVELWYDTALEYRTFSPRISISPETGGGFPEVQRVVIYYQERPSVTALTRMGIYFVADDPLRRTRGSQREDLEALLDGPPVDFIDPDGNEYPVYISAYQGSVAWQYDEDAPVHDVVLQAQRVVSS